MSKPAKEDICTNCGHPLNRVSIPGDEDVPDPNPGDATVCLYCSHLMVFDDNLVLRPPNDAEMEDLAGRPDILEAMQFVSEYQRRYRS